MNPDHIEVAAVGASAASAAASKLTYGGSAVAVVAGTASTTSAAHQAVMLGLSVGEWCAVGGLLLAACTFGLNAWDKRHARKVRDHMAQAQDAALRMRQDEHDLRMRHSGMGHPSVTGEL